MRDLFVMRLDIGSVGKLTGAWAAFFGFIYGVIGGVTASVSIIANNSYTVLQDILVLIAALLFGIIIIPMLLFFLGWLHGAVFALVLDFLMSRTGGLKITVEDSPKTGK